MDVRPGKGTKMPEFAVFQPLTGTSYEETTTISLKRITYMTALTAEQVLENIYTSLQNDNEDIDTHIGHLKTALQAQNKASVEIDPTRLAHNNRSGRKLMQSYFKKRGVVVTFVEKS
jgi:hypothetical protein